MQYLIDNFFITLICLLNLCVSPLNSVSNFLILASYDFIAMTLTFFRKEPDINALPPLPKDFLDLLNLEYFVMFVLKDMSSLDLYL